MPAGSCSTGRWSRCCHRFRGIDVARLHAFADQLARADAEDAYRASGELLSRFLARMIAGAARRQLAERRLSPAKRGDAAPRRLCRPRALGSAARGNRTRLCQHRPAQPRSQASLTRCLLCNRGAGAVKAPRRSPTGSRPVPAYIWGDAEEGGPAVFRQPADLRRQQSSASRSCLLHRGMRCDGAGHGPMLVDSHCHLDFPDFAAEREAIIARARFGGRQDDADDQHPARRVRRGEGNRRSA